MPSLFNPAKQLILLPCIIVCAGCASVPQTCVQCSLSCDEAPELKKHDRVIVLVEHLSENVHEVVCTVSSLCDGGRCSVPGCFQRDTLYTLKLFAHDDEPVPKVLMNKTIRTDCGPEGISDPDGAVGNLSNKFLILMAFFLFHLLLPWGTKITAHTVQTRQLLLSQRCAALFYCDQPWPQGTFISYQCIAFVPFSEFCYTIVPVESTLPLYMLMSKFPCIHNLITKLHLLF